MLLVTYRRKFGVSDSLIKEREIIKMRRKTIWANFRYKGITCICIALGCLVVLGVATFFLVPDNAILEAARSYTEYFGVSELSSVSGDIQQKIKIIKTIWTLVVELLIFLYPMIDYLFFYHAANTARDPYNWVIHVLISSLVGLILIFITDAILGLVGWITLIQILCLAIVVAVPRFFFKPF